MLEHDAGTEAWTARERPGTGITRPGPATEARTRTVLPKCYDGPPAEVLLTQSREFRAKIKGLKCC